MVGFYGCFSYTHDQSMGLQAIMNVGYAHTIKYKLINCSWTVAAVGKGPHFLQKNPQQNFLAIWAWPAMYIPAELASKEDPISIRNWDIHIC